MLHDVYKSVGGFGSYGMISMIIFIVFFALLVLYAISIRKKDAEDFSRMPLDDFSKESDEIQDS